MTHAAPLAIDIAHPFPAPSAASAVLGTLAAVILGLWFGGLATLILFVAWLFSKNRGVALDAAPLLFHVFERYQLALAAVALLTLVLWRSTGRRPTKTLAVAATLLATGLAVLQIAVITPTITASQNTDRPKFDTYHHLASFNYTTVAVLVLIALVLALAAARREAGLA